MFEVVNIILTTTPLTLRSLSFIVRSVVEECLIGAPAGGPTVGKEMSLEDYKRVVRSAAKRRDGTLVYNGSVDHASILAEAIFENANKYVWILSEKLNARVYGREEVIEQAELFLADPDHEVRVIVEDGSEANRRDHPFFEKFASQDNVKFRAVDERVAGLYKFNAIVMDGDCYRFESDKAECTAVAAFGDPDKAEVVQSLFETIWQLATPLDSLN